MFWKDFERWFVDISWFYCERPLKWIYSLFLSWKAFELVHEWCKLAAFHIQSFALSLFLSLSLQTLQIKGKTRYIAQTVWILITFKCYMNRFFLCTFHSPFFSRLKHFLTESVTNQRIILLFENVQLYCDVAIDTLQPAAVVSGVRLNS